MTNLLKYSKTFHWLIILCLTLPFYYTGCERHESTTKAKAMVDSETVLSESQQSDTVSQENLITDSAQSETLLSDSTKSEKEEILVSQKIAKIFPLLKPILTPREDTFSGLAMLIDNIRYISYFGIFLFGLFLSLSLFFKYFDKTSLKTFLLFDTFSLLFLSITEPFAFGFHRLWGFWITLGLVVILTLFDFYILYNELKKQKG